MQKIESEANRIEVLYKYVKKYFKPISPILRIVMVLIIMLLVLELTSFVAVSTYRAVRTDTDPRTSLSVYDEQVWAADMFREEVDASEMKYEPYVAFRRASNYRGKYVNLDKNSHRKTSECGISSDDPIQIFVFGGSTVWGTGARDQATIPSFVSQYLCEKNMPVKVTNFGESGYTNTQEVIKLQLELRAGNRPDIVIFYDGHNDIFTSYQSNSPGTLQNRHNRIADFNARNSLNLRGAVLNSYTMQIINKLTSKFRNSASAEVYTSRKLKEETALVYLENIRIIRALEQEFAFKAFFYWQPSIYSKSTVSKEEKQLLSASLGTYPYLDEMHEDIAKRIRASEEVIDLAYVFDDIDHTVFIDEIHISEEGNKIVSEHISEDIINYLKIEARLS